MKWKLFVILAAVLCIGFPACADTSAVVIAPRAPLLAGDGTLNNDAVYGMTANAIPSALPILSCSSKCPTVGIQQTWLTLS